MSEAANSPAPNPAPARDLTQVETIVIRTIGNVAGTAQFEFTAASAARQLMPLLVFIWPNGRKFSQGLN